MKIYTKSGDKGTTSLFGGTKVDKDHPLIEAYGTVDELNAWIGISLIHLEGGKILEKLVRIQNELFELGSDLATPWEESSSPKVPRVGIPLIERLEKEIDGMERQLAPLKSFILPGGSELSSKMHLARTICRRAERSLIRFSKDGKCNPNALVYLNRLSDWFFVLARFANRQEGVEDIPWKP